MLNKIHLLGSLTIAFGLSLASPLLADYAMEQNSNINSSKIVSDQDITKSIHNKIGAGWFSKGYDKVSYQVNNGIVTLDGSVETQADKEKVEKEVRNIEGVKSVNSQITVLNPSKDGVKNDFPQDRGATPADVQLNKKIRDNVSIGWIKNDYKNVNLNTTDGFVLIEGIVNDTKDGDNLVIEIQKVEGVRGVKNNTRTKNP